MRSLLRGAAVVLVAMVLLPATALADGQLDPSFGNGGRIVLSHADSAGAEGASSLLLLGGGRFLTAGIGEGSGTWVTQNLANGALDASFGEGGGTFFAPAGFTFTSGAVREADGAIVVAGGNQPSGHTDRDTYIARLTAQGGIDPSFGNDAPNPAGDGVSLYDFGGDDEANDLVLDSSGKIVVVGRVGEPNEYDVLLARLNSDGSVDASFGGPIGVHTELGASAEGLDVALQGERLVVLASAANGTYVLRYLPGGTLDPSFGGGDGIAPVGLPGGLEDGGLLVEPDGDIVVSGGDGERAQIARLLADGLPDTSFGSGGVASFEPPEHGKGLFVGPLARMDDGRIIAAGSSGGKGDTRTVLIRTLPNGQPDPAWGSGGELTIPSPSGTFFEGFGAMVVEPDRRILLGGEFFGAEEDDNRVVMRILGDTTPPDTAITKAPPATAKAPLANAGFAFAAVGDTNTSFECALTKTLAKRKKHKKHHHRKRRHRKKHRAKAHASRAATPTAAPAFAPCTSPIVYPLLGKPGEFRFAVRSIDPAGNVDPTPAEANVHLVAKKHRNDHKRKHHQRPHRR